MALWAPNLVPYRPSIMKHLAIRAPSAPRTPARAPDRAGSGRRPRPPSWDVRPCYLRALPWARGQAAAVALRPDRTGRGDLGAEVPPGRTHGRGHVEHAGAADPARSARHGPAAARSHVRPLRGPRAAELQPQRRAAA